VSRVQKKAEPVRVRPEAYAPYSRVTRSQGSEYAHFLTPNPFSRYGEKLHNSIDRTFIIDEILFDFIHC
jgi:hypothetical protein